MVVNENVLGLIGNTPMVDVSQLSPNPDVRIIGKLESQNPFGSVKDRIAKHMIEQAEKDGRLKPGQTIMEPSSGNTGIALAAIAQMKGYPIKILMPTSVSIERRQMLEVFGAELILTPGEEGSNGAVRRAMAMADEHPEYCFLYQYGNDNNPMAHYEGTGPEIWRDCPEITHFVAGLGTSGTLMGTGRYLKEQNPDVKVVAEWPDVALPPIGIDRYTAFVALTHDPKIDDPGLDVALKSDCFYIGALGSRKTHARRVERLKAERGFNDNDIGRIHSPIGLDIGSVSPAEIAVAIIGEITAALRQEPA